METVFLKLDSNGGDASSWSERPVGFNEENLAATIWQVASSRLAHPAIALRDGRFSYGWLTAAAARVRNFLLAQADFRPGQRIALMLENSPEYLAAFYGVLAADGVVVPLPPRIERERGLEILRSCEPVLVFSRQQDASPETRSTANRILPLGDGTETPVPFSGPFPGVQRGGRDLAMILYTSGSTGAPKGVMLSHRNLLANARSIRAYLPIQPDDRALVVLPFCHAFGNSILQTHLLAGATLVLDGSLAMPVTVMKSLREHRATSFSGVPEVYALLLRFAQWDAEERLTDLRYMTVAGGALRPEVADEVVRRIAPASLYVMYGQSEATARLSYLPPEELRIRRGSIGKAIPGVELRVVDEHGSPVPAGEVGMLQARGENVMLGYWRDPAATEAAFQDGWLQTGDHATLDPDGYAYLRGRASLLVKLQGNRFHPLEVEEIVARCIPGAQVAVLPYQADDFTRLALFCVPPAGGTWTELDVRRVCARELPRYMIPNQIELLERMPLTDSLKVDRPALAGRLGRRHEHKEVELCCK